MITAYNRMPGRHRLPLGTAQSLWMGADHLLLVSRNRFSETYSRFYYRDIQSIVIIRNDRWKAWFLPLAPLAIVTFVAAMMSDGWARFAWGVPSAIAILALIIDILLGPSCATSLRTAVQTLELLSLRRLRTAEKTADLLRSAIEDAQNRILPDALAVLQAGPPRLDARDSAAPPPETASVFRAKGAVSGPAGRDSGNVHAVLFAFLLADGAMSALMLQNQRPWIAFATFLIETGIVVSSVGALIRQRGTDIDRNLVRTVWGTVAYWGIGLVLGYAVFISFSIQRADKLIDYWEYIRYVASLSPFDSPLNFASTLFSLVVSIPMGAYGFLLLSRYRKRSRPPRLVVPPPRA